MIRPDIKALFAPLLAGTALFAGGFAHAKPAPESSGVERTQYCFGVVFRETPYADIGCARPTAADKVEKRKHFQFDYDVLGRLIEVRYMQTGELRPFSDRFVRSPMIKIAYSDDQEIRTFYNEFGDRSVVSGDVYTAIFDLDERGRRKALRFYGLDGAPINNDFGIAHYQWQPQSNGSLIETRYNLNGDLVRNRPGFGYFKTQFYYDSDGYIALMVNYGAEDSLTPEADEAGVVMTSFVFDKNGVFRKWINLDGDGKPRRGLSNIAEIDYTPNAYGQEGVVLFIDADGSPQTTNWGAHKIIYEHDNFGNEVRTRFFDVTASPMTISGGLAEVHSVWDKRGAYRLSQKYFNLEGEPSASGSGIHETRTQLDKRQRPVKISYHDLEGNLLTHVALKYSTQEFTYDASGSLRTLRFLTPDGELVDHGEWGFAKADFTYDKDGNLTDLRRVNAEGETVQAQWNPAH